VIGCGVTSIDPRPGPPGKAPTTFFRPAPARRFPRARLVTPFGDKGYISQALFELLFKQNLQLITKIKKNMKNKLMPMADKILLRKRALIETVNDQLKNISQVEHTRHRSITGFMLNLLGALVAYTYQEKKSSLHRETAEPQTLPAIV
jgi:hypothetical protein